MTGSRSFDVHPVNSSDPPRIQFTSDGQYGASDGINYTSGRFTITKSGFDAQFGVSTGVGYVGTDQDESVVVKGIVALVAQVPVTVSTTTNPNTITMTVKGYELTFQRGRAATTSAPEPSSTGPAPSIGYGTPPNCDLSTAPGSLPCPGDSIASS